MLIIDVNGDDVMDTPTRGLDHQEGFSSE